MQGAFQNYFLIKKTQKMGYTHYWRRPKNLDFVKFKQFALDCKKILNYSENELGIKLGDMSGAPGTRPEIKATIISFNGSDEQDAGNWTTTEQISIPWPSSNASLTDEIADPSGSKTSGNWAAGTLVSQRVAPLNNLTGKGSGSYESVFIPRNIKPESYQKADENGNYFECCKTAYRPYDLAVTAVLIALKHHFPEVQIRSDGEVKDWLDGQFLCNNILGYGMDFSI
jgi:hypothetical protein